MTPRRVSPRAALLALLLVGMMLPLILACGGLPVTLTTAETASWACPSPTPLPYGEEGPIKQIIRHPQPTASPGGPVRYSEEPVYYAQWEQEYSSLGGPPFPSPTPYVVVGTTYSLGQRVRIPPLFAQVTAAGGAMIGDRRRLYLLTIRWVNPTAAAIPFNYAGQVTLRAIVTPDGRELTDAWRVSAEAMEIAGVAGLPDAIPPGESQALVPVLAPTGEPETVDLAVLRSTSYTPLPGAADPAQHPPTSTPEAAPTTNADLRAPGADLVVVQFVNAAPGGPSCDSPGATTDYAIRTDGHTINGVPDGPVAAPAGAGRVVQVALNQVGKRYVWGAMGPESFDCSGLMVWAYAQVGIRIPARTSYDQFARLRPVDRSQLQPGDLVYFAQPGAGVSHVGMLAGDTDGDGTWDLVHAMSPRYGIRVTPDIFHNGFYTGAGCSLCIVGFRTMR